VPLYYASRVELSISYPLSSRSSLLDLQQRDGSVLIWRNHAEKTRTPEQSEIGIRLIARGISSMISLHLTQTEKDGEPAAPHFRTHIPNVLRLRNDSLNAPAPSMGTLAEIT